MGNRRSGGSRVSPPLGVGIPDRRARARTPQEDAATGVVELVLRDPKKAAAELDRDLSEGEDPEVVLALLDSADTLGKLRGFALSPLIGAIRNRLRRRTRGLQNSS